MLSTIENECSEFLSESIGNPLLKRLPKNDMGFRKVKVRKKNKNDDLSSLFDKTFKNDYSQILQRCVYAYGESAIDEINITDNNLEDFYIFPINGYKYMYSENVLSTTDNYKNILNLLMETVGDDAIEMFQEVLKYNYKHDKMYEALTRNIEIIIYNIPYYYAVRRSLIENYYEFLIS